MGLLDILNNPDNAQALGLLGQGIANRNVTGGANAAMGLLAGADQRRMQKEMLGLQMQNMQSEIAARQAQLQKQQQMQDMLGKLLGPQAVPPAQMGQLGSGSFGVVPPAGGAPAIPSVGGQGGGSRIGSVSPDMLALLKAQGLDLVDVAKFAQPDMQVSNNFAYDKKTVKPGFMPGMNVSQNGQASVTTIGPDGMPVVRAPTGALDTYAGYRNIDESAKANFDPVTVTPQGQNPQMTTRGALVRNPLVQNAIPPAVQAQRDAERQTILQGELVKAQAQLNAALGSSDQSAAARAQADIAALQREMGSKRTTLGLPLQSPEEALRASEGVKGDAKRNEDQALGAQKSKDTLNAISMARDLLKKGPTASGVGAAADTVQGFFGGSNKGADLSAQLDTLSGWMVNNVPRMEGPQSNYDVKNYQTMAAMVGDRTKPVSQRLAALNTLEGLQQKYAHLNTGAAAASAPAADGWGIKRVN